MLYRHVLGAALLSALLLAPCAAGQALAAEANAFNPHTGKPLPMTRQPKGDEAKILAALGGKPRSVASDAGWRTHWREEVYPVLQGSLTAPHEVLVVVDFADPRSRTIWAEVVRAARAVPADQARFVLFGRSSELYATDLTGLAIWAARERKAQVFDYVTWAMQRWDAIKAGQKKQGRVRVFQNEYDAVLTQKDYPLVFIAMDKVFRPGVPEREQSALASYAYEAGNLNLFQTTEVCSYYKLSTPSGLIVDGRVLENPAELVSRLR